jgi:hypothetical protein
MASKKRYKVAFVDGKWMAECQCGKMRSFSHRPSAVKMLQRGTCSGCRALYVPIDRDSSLTHKNKEGKWCSTCSGCGKEQAYTRKDHAKQSTMADWQCRSCCADAKKFSNNLPVGPERRVYNKFMKSAQTRNIEWNLSLEDMYANYTGKCALTDWEIALSYDCPTASLDRIDSSLGYTVENIQWVHTMVNMSKNKYLQEKFLEMCIAVSNVQSKRKSSLKT